MRDSVPNTTVEQARRLVLENTHQAPTELVDLSHALWRTCAVEVRARADSPAYPLSAMDGYAVPEGVLHAFEAEGKATARVIGTSAAGSPYVGATPGPCEAIRILTGAVVPPWAVSVVKQEDCVREGDTIVVKRGLSKGRYIRPAGSDVHRGDILCQPGQRLTPPVVAALAAHGISRVELSRPPALTVVVTGSEIVAWSDGELPVGMIRDSNGPMLEALARSAGAVVASRHVVSDEEGALADVLAQVLGETQMLLLSGGVSVGDRDIVKKVLEDLGVRRVFWRVAQRPGKPVYFGVHGSQQIFGLPGNPVSAFVCFLLYVRPSIMKAMGTATTPRLATLRARLAGPAKKAKGYTGFLRGKLRFTGEDFSVVPHSQQDSHAISSLMNGNCLIVCPPEFHEIPPGTVVEVLPYPWVRPEELVEQ